MKNSFFALLLAIGIFCLPEAADAQKLSYQLKKDQTFETEQKAISAVKQTMQGMSQNIDTEMTGSQVFKVTEVSSSAYKIEVRYKKLSSVVSSVMMNVEIDSEGDQENSSNRLMKSMVDIPFFLLMSKSGKIEKVEGHEALRKSVDNALETVSLQEKMALLPMIENMIGEAALKKAFAQAFIVYPDEELKKGSEWKSESEVPGQMEATVNQTYTVESISGDVLKLKAVGAVKTKDPNKVTKMNGINIMYDLSGEMKGSYEINMKTGLVSKSTTLGNMSGNMTLKAGGQIPADMLVPMEISSETVVTSK